MKLKWLRDFLFLILLLASKSWGSASSHQSDEESKLFNPDLLTMPEGCIQKKSVPCVVKSLSYQNIEMMAGFYVTVLKDSMVRIVQYEPLTLVPLKRGFKVEKSHLKLYVKDVKSDQSVALNKFPSFVYRTNDQIQFIDGQDFYQYNFNDKGFEKTLLDRIQFLQTIAPYYKNKEELKEEFSKISIIYNKSFKKDVVMQGRIMQRQIASLQEQKKKDQELQNKKKSEQLILQENLFKRTFGR